jgi:hypothetical protein
VIQTGPDCSSSSATIGLGNGKAPQEQTHFEAHGCRDCDCQSRAAVQAMEFAHKMIGAEVYTSKEYRAGELHWAAGSNGDLGFPLADSIVDLGPKHRDDCDILSPLGVPASELEPGGNYFIVTHIPGGLPWPNVESLVYLGENVTGEDPGKLVFQDTGSYCEVGPYPNNTSGDIYLVTTERDTLPPNLFDLNGVLDQLNRYAAQQARAAARKKR